MAIKFNLSTDNSSYLTNTTALAMAAPWLISAWAKTEIDDWCGIFSAGSSGSSTNWLVLGREGSTGKGWYSNRASTQTNVLTGNDFTVGEWHHIVGWSNNSADHNVVLDGNWGQIGQDNTTRAPGGLNRCSIGMFADSSPTDPWDGIITKVGFWTPTNVDAGFKFPRGAIQALIDGAAPKDIMPQWLRACPDLRQYKPRLPNHIRSDEFLFTGRGSRDLQSYADPFVRSEPRRIYFVPADVGGDGTILPFMMAYH